MMRWRKSMVALASTCLISGCQEQKKPDAERRPAATEQPAVRPALPVAQPTMDRAALLLAAMRAASEAALGRTDEEEQRKLDGRRFELRMRFGCDSTAPDDQTQSRGWSFDEKRHVLSLTVEPEIADGFPVIQSLESEGYEAGEGFWFHRPWLLKAACPAVPEREQDPDEAPPPVETPPTALFPPQRIGIAQFFTKTDARTHRRDNRPYKTTKVLAEGETPSAAGYDLVISGRLRRLTDGRVIACRNESLAAPPSCIISAQFDNVSIETPGTGETIAKWSGA